MADLDKLTEELSGLTVLEVADLVKALEEKWGVSAAAPVAVAGYRGRIFSGRAGIGWKVSLIEGKFFGKDTKFSIMQ